MAEQRRRQGAVRCRTAFRLLGILLLTLVAPLEHPVSTANAAPLDPYALAAQVEPGLVQLSTLVEFQGVVGNGAGIVLTPDGQVLSSHHVVQGANSIKAVSMANGQTYHADIVGYDRDDDIVVLQLFGAAGLPVAPLGDSNSVAVGDPVVTIGNANGTGRPLTHEAGTVTSLTRAIDAEDELSGSKHRLNAMIESSTNLRAGDSGGALVNAAGQVVGLNAAAALNFKMNGESTPGGQGFAIPINRALDIANQIRSGVPSPSVHIGPSAMLGIGISAAPPPTSDGLPVRSVLRGGPADQVGLSAGDVITVIDGVRIDSASTLTGLLDQRYPGEVIDVNWIDGAGVPRNAKLTLVAGPVS